MKIQKIKIAKWIVTILAFINLILVFGFEYKLSGQANKKHDSSNIASTMTTEENMKVESDDVLENETEENSNRDVSQVPITEEPKEEYESQIPKCKVIIKGNARIRTGPGLEYEIIVKVPSQTILTILGQEKEWYHIRTEDNIEGYISSDLVELLD